MIASPEVIQVTSSIESLMSVFEKGHVAIVVDGEQFLGLITRIDLLNYLRRKVN
jgi:cystathionine beta-synthase